MRIAAPDEEFDLSECIKCTVDDHVCVRVKHNRYSTLLRPGTEAEVRGSLACGGEMGGRTCGATLALLHHGPETGPAQPL
jgi:hypothetical protein